MHYLPSAHTHSSNEKSAQNLPAPRKRGPRPKPIVEFPEATTSDWIDPSHFHEALRLHVKRHGETICHLHRSLVHQGDHIERSTLLQWAAGKKLPRTLASFAILNRIERRYRLPDGYFKSKLPNQSRAPSGHTRLKGYLCRRTQAHCLAPAGRLRRSSRRRAARDSRLGANSDHIRSDRISPVSGRRIARSLCHPLSGAHRSQTTSESSQGT